jgi:hypothetical protein
MAAEERRSNKRRFLSAFICGCSGVEIRERIAHVEVKVWR